MRVASVACDSTLCGGGFTCFKVRSLSLPGTGLTLLRCAWKTMFTFGYWTWRISYTYIFVLFILRTILLPGQVCQLMVGISLVCRFARVDWGRLLLHFDIHLLVGSDIANGFITARAQPIKYVRRTNVFVWYFSFSVYRSKFGSIMACGSCDSVMMGGLLQF